MGIERVACVELLNRCDPERVNSSVVETEAVQVHADHVDRLVAQSLDVVECGVAVHRGDRAVQCLRELVMKQLGDALDVGRAGTSDRSRYGQHLLGGCVDPHLERRLHIHAHAVLRSGRTISAELDRNRVRLQAHELRAMHERQNELGLERDLAVTTAPAQDQGTVRRHRTRAPDGDQQHGDQRSNQHQRDCDGRVHHTSMPLLGASSYLDQREARRGVMVTPTVVPVHHGRQE